MSAAVHSSSSRRAAVAAMLFAGLALAGCTGTSLGALDTTPTASTQVKRATPAATGAASPAPTAPASKGEPVAGVDPVRTAALPGVASANAHVLPHCRYLREDAASQAAVLRSPTLSASVADGGDTSVALGMNLLDFAKAGIVQDNAELRCRQTNAEGVLTAATRLATQNATRAGHLAKAAYIASHMRTVENARNRARALVDRGDITIAESSVVQLAASRASSAENEARARAAAMPETPDPATIGIETAATALRESEAALQDHARRMRTLDAMKVELEGGWKRKDSADTLPGRDPESFYGKVSFGIRLGALSPGRAQSEENARQARLDMLDATYTGVIWQARAADSAIDDALSNLRNARAAIAAAMSNARQTASRLAASGRPEIETARMSAEIETVMLGAELAAADASIAELERNGAFLRAAVR